MNRRRRCVQSLSEIRSSVSESFSWSHHSLVGRTRERDAISRFAGALRSGDVWHSQCASSELNTCEESSDVLASRHLLSSVYSRSVTAASSRMLADYVFGTLIVSEHGAPAKMRSQSPRPTRLHRTGNTSKARNSFGSRKISRQQRHLAFLHSRQDRGRRQKRKRRARDEYRASEGIAIEPRQSFTPCSLCNGPIDGTRCCLAGETCALFVAHFGCLQEWYPERQWEVFECVECENGFPHDEREDEKELTDCRSTQWRPASEERALGYAGFDWDALDTALSQDVDGVGKLDRVPISDVKNVLHDISRRNKRRVVSKRRFCEGFSGQRYSHEDKRLLPACNDTWSPVIPECALGYAGFDWESLEIVERMIGQGCNAAPHTDTMFDFDILDAVERNHQTEGADQDLARSVR